MRAELAWVLIDAALLKGAFAHPEGLLAAAAAFERFIPDLKAASRVNARAEEALKALLGDMAAHFLTLAPRLGARDRAEAARQLAGLLRRHLKAARRLAKPLKAIEAMASEAP